MSPTKTSNPRNEHEHGWEVELQCPQCGHCGVPQYDGWTARNAIRFGNKPTIYVNVSCRQCGRDLQDVAGEKLKDLFQDVEIPPRNKTLIREFLLIAGGLPLLIVGTLWAGFIAEWWGVRPFQLLPFLVFLIVPAISIFNGKLNALRESCECGHPQYRFMGMLGRSMCYRCSSCGRLLRLRN